MSASCRGAGISKEGVDKDDREELGFSDGSSSIGVAGIEGVDGAVDAAEEGCSALANRASRLSSFSRLLSSASGDTNASYWPVVLAESNPEDAGEPIEALEVYDALALSSAGLFGDSKDPFVAFEIVLVRDATVGLAALVLPVLLDTE